MITFLFGEESLLLRRRLEKILSEKTPTNKEFNMDVFEGGETQAKKILEAVQTLPVFADRRLVLVRNLHEMKKGELDSLEKGLSAIPQTVDLVLTAVKIDQRLSFWKKLIAAAKPEEFKPLYPREVPAWIMKEVQSAGATITPEAVDWLVTAVGTDLGLLEMTLKKVYLFKAGGKQIELKDLEACMTSFAWKSLFDLTDAVGQKNLKKALPMFQKMATSGESPIALLALLGRHFRILSKVKEGATDGVPPYFLKDYQRQAGQFRADELSKKREHLFRTDWSLKSSNIDSTLQFESLLIQLCR